MLNQNKESARHYPPYLTFLAFLWCWHTNTKYFYALKKVLQPETQTTCNERVFFSWDENIKTNITSKITIWLIKQVLWFVLLCFCWAESNFKINVVFVCRGIIQNLENFQGKWQQEYGSTMRQNVCFYGKDLQASTYLYLLEEISPIL